MRNLFLVLLFISSILFVSCESDKLKIDTSEINIDISITRLDNELFKVDTSKIWEEIHSLSIKYEPFWDLYTYQILNIGGTNNKLFATRLNEFVSDPVIFDSYKEAQKVYESSDFISDELNNAFKHFKYYFPDKKIPNVYTYIGGFNQSIVTDEAILGIGLDKYLGAECKFYQQLGLPKFSRKHLTKANIPIDCMRAWSAMEFPFNDSIDYLLNQMIYYGKQLYFLKAMMPEKHDSLIARYSNKDLNYCIENEKEMYAYLVENQFLYSSKYEDILRFTKDGPFTSGFKNSPSRVGNWIGYQIVKSYIENKPNVTISQLMQISDHSAIFIASKYNP